MPPTIEQIKDSLQKAIDKSGIELEVRAFRPYGETRSARFELIERCTGEILFTMDIDVNRPLAPTKVYEIEDVRFCGVSPLQMIADKVETISSDKVFRRIKDVVDLYYFSKVFEFDAKDINQALQNSGRTLGDFGAFLHRTEDLKHSYEKFRFAGGINKLPFEEVYKSVKDYIGLIIPKEKQEIIEK